MKEAASLHSDSILHYIDFKDLLYSFVTSSGNSEIQVVK